MTCLCTVAQAADPSVPVRSIEPQRIQTAPVVSPMQTERMTSDDFGFITGELNSSPPPAGHESLEAEYRAPQPLPLLEGF